MLSKLSHRELIHLAKARCIPPLLPRFHKGQVGGRVCVVGGCEDYTGAPYFSANAAALMGVDLTHVLCEKNAGTVIKSYTPNLMVHPYLRMENDTRCDLNKVRDLIERMHVVVIGPGLGRDTAMFNSVKQIIKYILVEQKGLIPLVLDADALFLLCQDTEVQRMIREFPQGRVIITPNVVEFQRLQDALGLRRAENPVANIAKNLNCIVFEKGSIDSIASADGEILSNSTKGSNRRVGGQGDTLTGTIACMLAYSRAMYDFKICEAMDPTDTSKYPELKWIDYAMLSCYVGSTVTRECSRLAFEKKHRSMQTTDVNDLVGNVYLELFGDK